MIPKCFLAPPLAGALLLAPTLAQCPQQTFLASDGEDLLNYGASISIDGNRALIGASGHVIVDGRGYVVRLAGGIWTEEDILFPSDDLNNSQAAQAVALDGNVAVLGAPQNDTAPVGNSGAVYLFERTGSTWTETAKIIEPVLEPNNRFGWSLALDGDLLFIGAPGAGPGNEGVVYVYEKGATWAAASIVAVLTAQDGQPNDFFGASLSLDDDQLAVGADFEDGTGVDQGAVYVFERPGGGWATAVSDAKLTAGLPEDRAHLGFSVALDGSRILAGAPGDASNDKGAVLHWDRVGTSWVDATEDGSMTPTVPFGIRMGTSVTFNGDMAYAGAPASLTGQVRRFLWNGTDWTSELPITPPGVGAGDTYGSAVAMRGSELWVGAEVHREGSERVGAVYRVSPRMETNYCVGAANSDGGGAHISACGSTSLADNALQLVVTGAANNLPGLFFYGANQAQIPFGDGFRCVGTPIFRLIPNINSDQAGSYFYALDVTSPPASQGPGTITAGSTWNFQYWYRDPAGPGGNFFNLSDAVAVTFLP